jgi:hypothetical protein
MNINLNKDHFFSFIIIIINIYIISLFNINIVESAKTWIAAKIFTENFKFLNSTYGPLYSLYLQFFLLFKFPYSLKIEAIVSTSIFSIILYYFLKVNLKKILSFLLVISFLPFFINIEPRQNILAASFFILYLIKVIKNKNEILPIELIICSLMGRAFFLLLIINFIFKISDIKKENIFNKKNYIKIFLIILYILSLTNQWKDQFNNHMISDPRFSPDINLNNPVELAFFQFNNESQLKKNNLEKKDWYISFKDIYGTNNTLIKIVINKPKMIFEHIFNNVPKLGNSIGYQFFTSIFKKLNLLSKIISTILVTLLIVSGFLFLNKEIKNHKESIIIALFISLFIVVLLVTNPTSRYLALIFPLFLFSFLYALKKILKKNFYIFIIFYAIFTFYFNLKKFRELSAESIYFNNKIISYITKISADEKERTIFTNEKNYLKLISNKRINYVGFDSIPPYYDKKIYDYLKQVDIIIFTEDAKSYDDISTKQGDRYLYYIKPRLKDKNWENIKIDNFYILTNKTKF